VTNDGTQDRPTRWFTIFQEFRARGPEAAEFNVGDTNQDLILNPGETWQFTATETVSRPSSTTATAAASRPSITL